MLKIAIVDDEKNMLEMLEREVKQCFFKQNCECEIKIFDNGGDFINTLKNQTFDLFFLDIVLPDFTGFQLAEEIQKYNKNSFIVFITSENGLVYDSFEYRPFNFICKNSSEYIAQKLNSVIEKIINYNKQNKILTLSLPYNEQKTFVISELSYVQSNNNNVLYHFINREKLEVRNKLSNVHTELAEYDFEFIHRKYLINMRNIDKLDYPNNRIFMRNNIEITIGKKYKDIFAEKYKVFERSLR